MPDSFRQHAIRERAAGKLAGPSQVPPRIGDTSEETLLAHLFKSGRRCVPSLGSLPRLMSANRIAAAGGSKLCTRPYHFSKIALILAPYVHFTAADLERFAVKRRPSGWRSGPQRPDCQVDDGGTPR